MKRRGISFMAALFLLLAALCIPAAAADEQTPSQDSGDPIAADSSLTPVQQNNRFVISIDPETANFAVTDQESGKVWYAFPPEVSSNSSLPKTTVRSLQSLVNVSYYNTDGNLVNVGSYSHSVQDGTFLLKKIPNGIKYIFTFGREGEGFVVPLEIVLGKDRVTVSVPYKEIEENGDGRICDLQLLPNFGCGNAKDDGYLFLPDGSGAIVNFRDADSHDTTYEQQVYGRDKSQDLIYFDSAETQNVCLPVYGIKNGDSAYLAVISQGQAQASIYAQTLNGYSSGCASFVHRESDTTGIQSKDSGRRIVTLTSETALTVSPKVEFFFLNGNDADYSGMARSYQKYLVDQYGLKKVDASQASLLNLEVFGGVQEQKTFLGFTVNSLKKATDLSEVLKMQEDFAPLGSNAVRWSLYGFLKGGFDGKTVTNVGLESKLGSVKQLNELGQKAGKDNVFLAYDFVRMYDHSWQSFKNRNLVKGMNGLMVERHFTLPSNGVQKEEFGYWNYYNPATVTKNAEKLLGRSNLNVGILYTNMGNELYSDFRAGHNLTREDVQNAYTEIFKNTADKGHACAVETGNAYALKDAGFLTEIPLTSNHFDIESYSVPFYTMVLHGYANIASMPLNYDSLTDDTFLHALESGTALTYRLTGCSPYELKDTKLDFLFNSEYTDHTKQTLTKKAKELAAWQKQIADQRVVSNKVDEEVSVTEYENGSKILVNYSDEPQTVEGQTLNAKSYHIVENS